MLIRSCITVLLTCGIIAFVLLTGFIIGSSADDFLWPHGAACKKKMCFEVENNTYKSNKECKCHRLVTNSINAAQHPPATEVKDSTWIPAWYDLCTSNVWGDLMKTVAIDHVVCGTSGQKDSSVLHAWGLQSSDHIYYIFSAVSLPVLAILLWKHASASSFEKSSQYQQGSVQNQAYHETDTYNRQMESSRWVSRVALICYTVVPQCRDVLLESNRSYVTMHNTLWFDLQSLKGSMRQAETWNIFLFSLFFVCATHMTHKKHVQGLWQVRKGSVMVFVWCMMGTAFKYRGNRLSSETFLVCVAMVIVSSPPSVLQTKDPGNYLMTMLVRDGKWNFPDTKQSDELGIFIILMFKGYMYKMIPEHSFDHLTTMVANRRGVVRWHQ
jgi:hypothetical protein